MKPNRIRLSTRALAFACIAFLLLLSMTLAMAATDSDAQLQIKAAIEKNSVGKVQVKAVNKTPVPGLFEVVSGQEIFYADATGRYGLVDGRLIDLVLQRDLTADRLDQLSRINFKQLPFELAIKTVNGNGRRALAVFEDPACPVCRSLTKFLHQLPNVTIYAFPYPVVSPASLPQAEAAWCSSNRADVWASLMQGNAAPRVQPCDTSGIGRILALGEALAINGTPTVFLQNGRRLQGATPPEQFIAALDAAEPQK
jgi:thiol:disulfide interchange protein DsbC